VLHYYRGWQTATRAIDPGSIGPFLTRRQNRIRRSPSSPSSRQRATWGVFSDLPLVTGSELIGSLARSRLRSPTAACHGVALPGEQRDENLGVGGCPSR